MNPQRWGGQPTTLTGAGQTLARARARLVKAGYTKRDNTISGEKQSSKRLLSAARTIARVALRVSIAALIPARTTRRAGGLQLRAGDGAGWTQITHICAAAVHERAFFARQTHGLAPARLIHTTTQRACKRASEGTTATTQEARWDHIRRAVGAYAAAGGAGEGAGGAEVAIGGARRGLEPADRAHRAVGAAFGALILARITGVTEAEAGLILERATTATAHKATNKRTTNEHRERKPAPTSKHKQKSYSQASQRRWPELTAMRPVGHALQVNWPGKSW
jgi:hypothetical protein